jgi:hypothetical protein
MKAMNGIVGDLGDRIECPFVAGYCRMNTDTTSLL